MSEKHSAASAGGLWESLKGKFNLGAKKPVEASLAGVRAPAAAPTVEVPDWSKMAADVQPVGWVAAEAPAPEPTPTMAPQPTATEVPVSIADTAAPPASELPDWLTPPEVVAPVPAAQAVELPPLPDWLKQALPGWSEQKVEVPALAPEAPAPTTAAAVPSEELEYLEKEEARLAAEKKQAPAPAPDTPAPLSAVEIPVVLTEAKVEVDPFATNREFNEYMETIRQAQEALASGIVLNPEDQRKALIAVARSNSLLPKLPPEVLKSVLLMRAVASGNPKFGRNDFQLEMLAAMDVIKGKK